MNDPSQILIKPNSKLSVIVADVQRQFPLLPLRTGVLFPGTVMTLQVGRPENLKMLRYCLDNNNELVAAYALAPSDSNELGSIHQIGVTAQLCDSRPGIGESLTVTIEGRERVVIDKIVRRKPYPVAEVSYLQDPQSVDKNIGSKINDVIAIANEITDLDPTYSSEQLYVLNLNRENPSRLADKAASIFHIPLAAKQELLETVNLQLRFERLLSCLNAELNRVAVARRIENQVQLNIEEEQKRHYLQQQLLEIRRQLGDDFSEQREATRFRHMIKNATLPREVADRATIEVDRLAQLPPASAEYGVTKNYLDWILSLPWGKCRPEDYEIADAAKTLSSEYYGPVNLKEQILQRLSVRKLMGGVQEGPTLCLVGAPGTGKASLAKAIAHALGKELVRISVGGISDASEIKGSPRTFLGAMPGKILRMLRDADACDPVVLIEDIDYFNMENDSTVNMALLEAIDTRWSSKFLDRYLGVPFDLSKVFFICSVRAYEEIPEQFISRFEVIELPGYIEKEKIVISKRYIIPKLLEKHGLLKSEVRFTDKALSRIINNYTMEAGLVGFSQQIEKIFRKLALAKSAKPRKSWSVSDKNLEAYLGPAVYIPERAVSAPEIGTAAGLAWTGSGGDLMFIEGLKMKGEGQITTTGSLGDVMRESIQAAHSYIRSKADILGIDYTDFNNFDIHIHFPSGAIPKDGPSAGVTVCLVIASVMAERPIRNDIAVTGEVTLRGRVLPVGGIKEKVSAAYRAGITHVALPKENEKDTKELPKEILRKTKLTYIERVDDLFGLCLLEFTPSSYTLEKIFAEEIEKAKKRKSRSKSKRSAASRSSSRK